jgi:hypothetical protein
LIEQVGSFASVMYEGFSLKRKRGRHNDRPGGEGIGATST